MNFSARLFDQAGRSFDIAGLEMEPTRWSASMATGDYRASVEVTGTDAALRTIFAALGKRISLANELGSPVWFGYVHEIELTYAGMIFRATLDELANRVRVLYTTEIGGGVLVARETEWADDTISQSHFGVWSRQESKRRLTDEAAIALRDGALEWRAQPVVDPQAAANDEINKAAFHCRGLGDLLKRTYYQHLAGRIANDGRGQGVPIGVGFGSDWTYFTTGGDIGELYAAVAAFEAGMIIDVSGSELNDGAYELTQGPRYGAPASYTATTIAFRAQEHIDDSGNGLKFIGTGEVFRVTGAADAQNNKPTRANSVDPEHIDIDRAWSGDTITAPAGPAVTLERGDYVSIDGPISNEHWLDNGTVTMMSRTLHLEQSFGHNDAEPIRLMRVALQMQKIGEPTFPVTVGIYEDVSGDLGNLLEEAAIVPAAVGNELTDVEASFNGDIYLQSATTYHVRVSVADANRNATDYYKVGILDETFSTYTLRGLGLAGWYLMAGKSLTMRIYGGIDLMELVRRVGESAPGVRTVIDPGDVGVIVDPYREGDQTVAAELKTLLETAEGQSVRLAVRFEPGLMQVSVADANARARFAFGRGGQMHHAGGAHLEPGRLPVGEMVAIEQLPDFLDVRLRWTPLLCAECEFDTDNGWTPTWSRVADFDMGYEAG